jgi:hypothetical protein
MKIYEKMGEKQQTLLRDFPFLGKNENLRKGFAKI